MPECENCGANVTNRYAKVIYPDPEYIPICPNCPGVGSTTVTKEIQELQSEGELNSYPDE